MTDRPIPRAPRQSGDHVWRATDVADQASWTWFLTAADVDELVTAAGRLIADGRDLGHLRAADVELPGLAARIDALRERLVRGRGFELISGFPVADVGDAVSAAAFVALGVHIGAPRSQNASGDLLGHVRNVGADVADPAVRIYQTDRRQTFHTDSTDVVGLMCLETAAEGGESTLVSTAAIYNEMLDREPDLASALFDPVATDRRGEVPEGGEPYFSIPVLNWYDGHLTAIYQRQYIESAQRFADVGPLPARMIAALDLFDEIADNPAMHLRMDLRPGDMQFVHNHSLLHDRTAFVDKPGAPRHLLRLWLSVPGDRELPPSFAQRYGSVTVGDRGGIVVPGTTARLDQR